MRRKLMSDSRIEPTIPILEGIVPNGPKSRVGSLTLPWHAVRGFARLFQGGSAEISAHCRVKCQVAKQGFWDDPDRSSQFPMCRPVDNSIPNLQALMSRFVNCFLVTRMKTPWHLALFLRSERLFTVLNALQNSGL